jgi:flagellar hook protein FlgE
MDLTAMIDSLGSVMSTAIGGMQAAERAVQEIAHRVANPERSLETIERDVVGLVMSSIAYTANVTVVRTADQMLGTLVDVRA